MVLLLAFSLLSVIVYTALSTPRIVRVALVGDSITELSNYPTELQTLLGTNFIVENFGVMGATVLSHTYTPYIDQEAFNETKTFQPDVIVILLGTNDARTDTYKAIDNFVDNYKSLVIQLQELDSQPKIFLVKPPPIFANCLDLDPDSLREGVIPRIEQVAAELGLTVIDVYSALENCSDCFVDGVHPSTEGGCLIANTVYNVLDAEAS